MIIRIIALFGVLIFILIVAITYTLKQAQKLPFNSPVNFHGKSAQDNNQKTVVCVGNSITHGQVSYNYVNILSERLSVDGYQFVNAGINGNLAYNVVNRLDKIIGCDPDYVTVLIGTKINIYPGRILKVNADDTAGYYIHYVTTRKHINKRCKSRIMTKQHDRFM